jgi:hypothetical protein
MWGYMSLMLRGYFEADERWDAKIENDPSSRYLGNPRYFGRYFCWSLFGAIKSGIP